MISGALNKPENDWPGLLYDNARTGGQGIRPARRLTGCAGTSARRVRFVRLPCCVAEFCT